MLAALLFAPAKASAEWQLKPSVGLTFHGATTFILGQEGASHPNLAIGIGVVLLGEVVGIEADVADMPGFFQPEPFHVVVSSRVTTFTGNIVVAMPRRMTKYTLRPYLVAGGGLMGVHIGGVLDAVLLAKNIGGIDIGGGATGFLTNRIGLNWDVRYFRSVGGTDEGVGISIGPEQLSFWRANMAVVIRF